MLFKVEYIADSSGTPYLLARQMEAGEIRVTPASQLGGVPIRPYLSQPRAHTSDGRPDLTLYTFVVCNAADLAKLSVGQPVELTTPD